MSEPNLRDGFYLVQDGVGFQWYAKRKDAEKALTQYSTAGWEVLPALEWLERIAQRKGKVFK